MKEFTRDGEPLRWPNPEKEERRKNTVSENVLEEKRFLLPSNPEARELLEKLKNAVSDMKTGHPEVIGFAMHGSLIKGYATEKSDIDGYLLIDSDRSQLPADADNVDKYPFGWKTTLPNLLKGELEQTVSLPDKTKDIGSLDLNNEILEKYCETRDAAILYIAFLPTIGVGVNEYRKSILDRLEKMGEDGQSLWQLIVGYLWEDESLDFTPEIAEKRKALYPQTLGDARRYFLKEERKYSGDDPSELKIDLNL